MGEPSYHLADHAFMCMADDHLVFLDLRCNKYLCLGRKHTEALMRLLEGRLIEKMHSTGIPIRDCGELDASAAVQALLKQGLLVRSDECRNLRIRAPIVMPSTSIFEAIYDHAPRITAIDTWHFFTSSAIATTDLRFGSIDRAARRISRRKADHAMADVPPDRCTIKELLQAFCRLRPYYPRRYLCLFDSLALLHFLARYSIFPEWIYGVKLEPFAAHCWVQTGDVVVNDIIDRVRDYTPIMSV